ncbi:hypothetical protein LO762_14940 [Actinocorallia sp. API 0066]|uniref:hypothetical protein n=1 Tax=Actinocorallia sp. API 0066 TaxID=2896846 RepID=UPI001E46437B|nr:hypothetical protein [Actinocorallia sp. API 0066]MCD0450476.1 hypothetical protein [Actinocorallia sp. API 0066]
MRFSARLAVPLAVLAGAGATAAVMKTTWLPWNKDPCGEVYSAARVKIAEMKTEAGEMRRLVDAGSVTGLSSTNAEGLLILDVVATGGSALSDYRRHQSRGLRSAKIALTLEIGNPACFSPEIVATAQVKPREVERLEARLGYS